MTERLPRSGSVGAWLHGVATNRAIKHIRADARRRAREARFASQAAEEVEVAWDDVYQLVDEAIAALPERLHGPLVAHYLEGQSHAAIAEEQGIPRRTVSSRIQRGLHQVRRSLKRRGVPVASAALASFLGANAIEAAPPALAATLGKLAVAGVSKTTAASAAGGVAKAGLIGGIAMTTKQVTAGTLVAVAALACVALLIAYGSGETPAEVATPPKGRRAGSGPGTRGYDLRQCTGAAGTIRSSRGAGEGRRRTRAPGERRAHAQLHVTIHGFVGDTEGNPIAGAQVMTLVARDEHVSDVIERYTANTKNDGTYKIEGDVSVEVVSGSAAVFASADGYLQGREGLRALTDKFEVNFALQPVEYFVAGRVVTKGGRGIPEAVIRLQRYGYDQDYNGGTISNGGACALALADELGRFIVGIPQKGFCDFLVLKKGCASGVFTQIPTGTRDARFVLDNGGAIEGRVTHKDGKPAAGATVTVKGKGFPAEDILRMSAGYPHPRVTATTGTDGRYRVEGLGEALSYGLAAIDAEKKTRSLAKERVRVKAGQTTSGVDLVLNASDATVRGHVTGKTNGKPVYPMMLMLVPGDLELEGFGNVWRVKADEARTLPDGSYRMTVLRDYRTHALQDLHPLSNRRRRRLGIAR